ncbi:MAG TPA: SRPBCC family protein [Alphaproteobacteria bacterium]|nr:SRPBCC family protein [Alphaproteobacteria bacterium]
MKETQMAMQTKNRSDELRMEGAMAGHSGELTERQQSSRRAPQAHRNGDTQRFAGSDGLAKALGWFSIGLGLAQITAPRGVANMIGLSDDRGFMRYLGAREMAAGIGILTQQYQSGWLWGRVAGDLMDLALLASAFRADDARRDRLAGATAAVLGVTLLDIMAAQQHSQSDTARRRSLRSDAIRSTKAITIDASPETLYRFWRNFENLPRFMDHLESVHVIDNKRSHWIARGPGGRKFAWDSEVIEDRPNAYIAWRSTGNADVRNTGNVRFDRAPGDRGTEVRVEIAYLPPAGQVGATIAWMMGQAPEQRIQENLRKLKQLFELGETPTTEGQPSGRKGVLSRLSPVGLLEEMR